MPTPLCLPVEDWPALDNKLWAAAQKPSGFRRGHRPASKWSAATRRIAVQGYGQWLSFLARTGELDALTPPQERVTAGRVERFIYTLQERAIAPNSLATYLRGMLRMLRVIAPEQDWAWLQAIHEDAKTNARPVKNKMAHLVTPQQLYDLGIHLMETCEDLTRPNSNYHATRYRDGLIIAMWVFCPARIGNFQAIEIGRHLKHDDRGYWLDFPAAETKTGYPLQGEIPHELTPYIEEYLRVHRPHLREIATPPSTSRGLWIDSKGAPMTEHAVRDQLRCRTEAAFGRHVWPHLIRDCVASGIVRTAPERVGLVPPLLGNIDPRTSRKHYIHARGNIAHRQQAETIAKLRAEARGGKQEE